MNAPARDRIIGIALLAATVLAAVAGLLLAWDAVGRFQSAALLDEAADRRMAGRLADARRSARDAGAWEPSPAAALAELDPEAPDARERLERIPGRDPAVAVARALLDLRAGRAPTDLPEDGDAAWIRAALAARARPTLPPADQPAAMATLATVLPLLAAGAAGDPPHLRRILGAALLAAPRHPERAGVAALCAALDQRDPAAARALITARVSDPALRQRTLALWAALRGQPLAEEAAVPRPAIDGPGPRLALARARAAARDAAGVERIAAAAPEPERPRIRLAAAEAAGDAAAALPLVAAAGPRLAGLRRSGSFAVFDLVLADGAPVRLPVAVVVDGLELPAGRVERTATRFVVPVNAGPSRIEIRLAGTVIAGAVP